MTALKIRTHTHTWMPAKAFWTHGKVRKVGDQPRQDGDNDQGREHHPQGGHNAPGDPLYFWPMNVAVFTAMMPGVHCPMA